MIDENNTIVWAADYMPFGEADITVETLENHFMFPGQYYDNETEINYNWFRYYHSEIGRYLRSDPVGLEAGPNLYSYVLNSPIIFSDLTGLGALGTAIDVAIAIGSTISKPPPSIAIPGTLIAAPLGDMIDPIATSAYCEKGA